MLRGAIFLNMLIVSFLLKAAGLPRGDYLEEGFTVLSIDYYKKAIKLIDRKVSNAKYYIFSDDKKYRLFIGI
jgi:hypothetical protein